MTFCSGDGCAKFDTCFRALTPLVERNAKYIGLPIGQFSHPKDNDCYEPPSHDKENTGAGAKLSH